VLQQELRELATTTQQTQATSTLPWFLQDFDAHAPADYTPGFGGSGGVASSNNSGDSSPAPYVADAVYFNGSTWLSTNDLQTVNSKNFTASLWVNLTIRDTYWPIFVSDPAQYYTYMQITGVGSLGPEWPQLEVGNSTSGFFTTYNTSAVAPDNVWHHILVSVEAGNGSTVGHAKIYVDDIDVTGTISLNSINLNGLSFYLGADTFATPLVADLADVYIAPGVSLLDSNGDIPTSTRREFIDANHKPVDLGPNCANPTGTAPAICFSGDASSFPNNKGTGGAFTLTGTLTNATSSPSD